MMKYQKLKKIFFLPFIFYLLTINLLYSQTANEKEAQSEEKVEELKAIPVIEIPQKIEEAYTKIKEIEALKLPATPLKDLDSSFQSLLKENETFKKESTPEYFKSLPTRKLEDYEKKWNSFLDNLLGYKKLLESGSEKLSESRSQIQGAQSIWVLTYKNAKSEKAPEVLLKRLGDLDKDLKRIDGFLFKTLNNVLLLRDKITVEEISSKEIMTSITSAISENKSLLFTFDSPPIWEVLSDSTDSTSIGERWKSTSENISSSFKDFNDLYRDKFPFYILFFLIVLVVIFYLGRFAKQNIEIFEADKDETHSIKLLNNPFVISTLIALYVSSFFFPLAPRVVTEIFNILFIFPILLLFPTFISKVSRGPLYFITSIYLLQRILEVAATNTINQRIVVIVLILLTILALFWVMKIPLSKIPEGRKKIIGILYSVSKIMIIILSLTLVANLVGNTSLSRLILNGVMNAIYISLLLTTGYQVFLVLLVIFLKTKFANLFLTVRNNSETIKHTVLKIVKFATIIFWLTLLLNGFELYDPLKEIFINFMNTSWKIGETAISVGSIFLFFISIWVSVNLSSFIRFFLDGDILPRINLPRGVPAAISLMINYVILSLGLLFALVAVGFDLSKFAIVAGALGVGIGFGMQNIVNNFISGLILLFERPIQVGDTIGIQNLVGTVKRIGIRSSIIKGFDGSEEIVPNADLVSFRVTNWTLSDKFRRIEIKIGVEYGTDPEQVIELLKYSISSRQDVVKEPSPYVLFDGYGDNTLNFSFRFWTPNSGDWIFIKSEVLLYIGQLLKDAGIKIPYPQMDVHIKDSDDKNDLKIEKNEN